eukprot:4186390-Ditylum_brightwellii.AAC.1
MQQSAVMCLYRHHQDTIILSTLPPWQRCATVSCWHHYPGPQTRKLHQQCRGSVACATLQQTTLPLMSWMHWECNISGGRGGGEMEDVMVGTR